jgi:hypothetical protein
MNDTDEKKGGSKRMSSNASASRENPRIGIGAAWKKREDGMNDA